MPKVTWIQPSGEKVTADVPAGHNLMEAAVANNVPGVIGECGGCLSCATCHVYVDAEWSDRAGPPGEMENDMLEVTAAERRGTSRLSCQLIAGDALDGIVLHVPQA
ncbi:2Fe-2S ferredoxin [Dongia mobilis]|uniref:2Fe-2S ferredoxin n=1 Tax=Dongia mobilis TaxID=578943 RepID=A0A4R6WYZ1_9PROT|nr:2Fe-2S iron-sulfur cluster-binding protein [Dongia mobilis]TDQ83017.1 2Fe-2S ferredoxin [Dongia mobilis]